MKGRPSRPRIHQVVSGGQTGADRAALDWAITVGMPHGGFCPAGRMSEDGVIPGRYDLTPVPSTDYAARTRANVLGSDATVIFSIRPALSNGALLTQHYAEELGKPCLHLNAHEGVVAAMVILEDGFKHVAEAKELLPVMLAGRANDLVELVAVDLRALFREAR